MSRPFHFTVDPLASPTTWTVVAGAGGDYTQSGTLWTIAGGTAAERVTVRDTDTNDEADLQARCKRTGDCEFGIITNYQDSSNYYLFYFQVSQGFYKIFRKTTGSFTELGSYTVTPTSGTNYVIRATSENSGANKSLSAYIDGVLRIGPVSTSTKYSDGQCGIRTFPFGGLGTASFDWFAPNTSIVASSISPASGPPIGGTEVTVTGSDIGDGSLLYMGPDQATGVTTTPNTTIAGTTPANANGGTVDVTVKFGTSGSEEYSGTLLNGFTYTLGSGRANMRVHGARLNI